MSAEKIKQQKKRFLNLPVWVWIIIIIVAIILISSLTSQNNNNVKNLSEEQISALKEENEKLKNNVKDLSEEQKNKVKEIEDLTRVSKHKILILKEENTRLKNNIEVLKQEQKNNKEKLVKKTADSNNKTETSAKNETKPSIKYKILSEEKSGNGTNSIHQVDYKISFEYDLSKKDEMKAVIQNLLDTKNLNYKQRYVWAYIEGMDYENSMPYMIGHHNDNSKQYYVRQNIIEDTELKYKLGTSVVFKSLKNKYKILSADSIMNILLLYTSNKTTAQAVYNKLKSDTTALNKMKKYEYGSVLITWDEDFNEEYQISLIE